MYFCMDKLQVRTKGENIGMVQNERSNIHVYSYQNLIYIKNVEAQSVASQNTVEIFDMAGRLVYQGAANNAETVIPLQVSAGVYLVKLTSQEQKTITKKVMLNF